MARSIGPAELLEYDQSRVRGMVLEEGSPTAHVTIVARALDIPIVGRVEDALNRIRPGDCIALDGDHGQIFVRPGEDVELAFAKSLAAGPNGAAPTRPCATSRRSPWMACASVCISTPRS